MYVSRSPDKTPLYQIVRENYSQVFFEKEKRGLTLPFHLEREFRKYLHCGIPLYGMARLQCPHCHKDKFVAFSCKGRTLCPSCTGRRMGDTAKHLVEEVIPEVATRQWVLSMPYVFRFTMASNQEFLRSALAIFHRAINAHYIKKAKEEKLNNPKVGAITVVQRFGGALNLNVHFHSIYTDGVFYEDEKGKEAFKEMIPSHEEVVTLTKKLKHRLIRLYEKQFDISNEIHAIEDIQAQSVQNRDEFFKLPLQIGRLYDPPFEEFKGTRCFYDDGFSLHAKVKIYAHQRTGLEHLCRYIMRGPLAKERISYTSEGRVRLKLKTPYSDGTTHLEYTAEQFIKRMIALIPPPRQNLIRYVGVFGARHKKRAVITAMAKPIEKRKAPKKKIYRTPWAELMKHVFKEDVDLCEHCGTKLTLIAMIQSPLACRKILEHLKLPVFEVKANSARAPPEFEFFDQQVDYF